ncbi:MAG: ACP S-malonyltransferase [Deltaproteobacteria bacterium]|nr:ACP S-malonyltransferase [Deltaproteobacteria bacterium]MBI3293585.1 ACP S-malonyltransferase [Deltaproteobacteria bacterium]
MNSAAIFPGQGSQYVGMNKDLVGQFPRMKAIYEEASDALNIDLAKLCLDGPEDALQLTLNAQPAILTTSFAWFSVLKDEKGFTPSCGAGHSLGEYSALLAAGALALTEAVKLVRRRGELMQNAVPVGRGKMAALLGLDDGLTRELCESASRGPESIVVPANYNSPGQIVIAGNAEAVDRAEALANDKASKFKARKFIPLKVSAPFHCPLMVPVAEQFLASLQSVKWCAPAFPVIANVDAKPHEAKQIVERMQRQIFSPVLWTQCVAALTTLGCKTFVEPGPSKVLSGLVKRCADDVTAVSIDTFEDFKNFGG